MKRQIGVLAMIVIFLFSVYSFCYVINKKNDRISVIEKRMVAAEKRLMPVSDGYYDNNDIGAEIDVEAVQKSLVWLVTKTKFSLINWWKRGSGQEEAENIQIGSGFVVTLPQGYPKGKYILTLDHIVSAEQFLVPAPPFGMPVNIAEKKISEKTYLMHDGQETEIEELFNNKSDDMALYRLPDDINIPSFPYAFGVSDKLKTGNTVYLLGHPRNLADMVVRKGIVSNVKGWSYPDFFERYENYNKIKKMFETWAKSKPQNSFQISAGLNGGDSGCPIVAFKKEGSKKVPELVGLAQAKMQDGMEKMGLALKIDYILGVIRNYFGLPPT